MLNNINFKILLPGMVSNVLEWYDFLLYGFLAPALAQLFFPDQTKTTALLITFAIFAIGFLMRPLGAVIFGHFGDRFGRKATLVVTISLMAIATTLIGCLPTYAIAGNYAGILLVGCRLLQGLALGGEFGYSIYLIEHAASQKRGLYGSLAMFSASLGMLFSSAIVAILHNSLASTQLTAWGWRMPFLFGILLGVMGLYFRLRLPESPLFLAAQKTGQILNFPLYQSIKQKPLLVVQAILLVFLPALTLYIGFVYMPTYITTYTKMSMDTALTINTIGMIFILAGFPLVGYLSDKIGRKPIFIMAGLICCVIAYPLFLLALKGTFTAVFLAQLGFVILLSLSYAILPTALVEMVPTNIRYSTMALVYNVGNSVFGGTAPVFAIYLIQKTGNIFSPCWYLIISGVVMLLIALNLKDNYQERLS